MNKNIFKRIIKFGGQNDFKILTGKEIGFSDIKDAVELDKKVYSKEFRGDFLTCIEWHNKNSFIYFMVKDMKIGHVIAYINIMPVSLDCYEKIKHMEILDINISSDMLLNYLDSNHYFVYFSSIVIHPEYRNTNVIICLFKSVLDYFIGLNDQGIVIEKIFANAITYKGRKLCKLFDMNEIKINNQSSIYELNFPFYK